MSMSTLDFLTDLLHSRLPAASAAWIAGKAEAIGLGLPDSELFLAFSQAIRYSGKAPLQPSPAEIQAAKEIHPGWDIRDWTCDVAARALFMASLPNRPESAEKLLLLHQSADLGEHLALVKALFLAPHAEKAAAIAREGLRSNMKTVFDGIALRNPYPAQYFDETAFNQMVVKCLFVDSPLGEILGLDTRRNPRLSQILVDLAQERWAAGREVSPEMWRCIGAFVDEPALAALQKALTTGDTAAKNGAALGLMADPSGQGEALLRKLDPERAAAALAGNLTWDNLNHA